jgi:hypothetical protein
MRRFLSFLLPVLFLSVYEASAQSYMKNEVALNAGVGFGVIGYGTNGTYSYSPPLSFSAEYSVSNHFGVGAYVGYLSRRYTATRDYSKFNALSYGARGTLHFSYFLNELLNLGILEDKLDLYTSVLLGVEDVEWNSGTRPIGAKEGKSFRYGAVGGARYFFTENVGAFAEIGRGVHGTFTLGVSTRL